MIMAAAEIDPFIRRLLRLVLARPIRISDTTNWAPSTSQDQLCVYISTTAVTTYAAHATVRPPCNARTSANDDARTPRVRNEYGRTSAEYSVRTGENTTRQDAATAAFDEKSSRPTKYTAGTASAPMSATTTRACCSESPKMASHTRTRA